MSRNPLVAAHRNALHNARVLHEAFGRYLGGSDHPRGAILSLYRDARRDVGDRLRAERRTLAREIDEVLERLERDLRSTTSAALGNIASAGQRSAEVQARYYQEDGQRLPLAQQPADLMPLQTAWLGVYEQQRRGVGAALAASDLDLILGGEDRMGILQPAPVNAEGSHHLGAAFGLGFIAWLFGRDRPERDWRKQAIAAIDSRTTETCLNVTGQSVPFTGKFTLTGTPRFSRRQDWSPFHWYCRTSIALYKPEYDDGVTEGIRDKANAEKARRESQEDKT